MSDKNTYKRNRTVEKLIINLIAVCIKTLIVMNKSILILLAFLSFFALIGDLPVPDVPMDESKHVKGILLLLFDSIIAKKDPEYTDEMEKRLNYITYFHCSEEQKLELFLSKRKT